MFHRINIFLEHYMLYLFRIICQFDLIILIFIK